MHLKLISHLYTIVYMHILIQLGNLWWQSLPFNVLIATSTISFSLLNLPLYTTPKFPGYKIVRYMDDNKIQKEGCLFALLYMHAHDMQPIISYLVANDF